MWGRDHVDTRRCVTRQLKGVLRHINFIATTQALPNMLACANCFSDDALRSIQKWRTAACGAHDRTIKVRCASSQPPG